MTTEGRYKITRVLPQPGCSIFRNRNHPLSIRTDCGTPYGCRMSWKHRDLRPRSIPDACRPIFGGRDDSRSIGPEAGCSEGFRVTSKYRARRAVGIPHACRPIDGCCHYPLAVGTKCNTPNHPSMATQDRSWLSGDMPEAGGVVG